MSDTTETEVDESNEPEPKREQGGGVRLAAGDPFDPDDDGPYIAHSVALPADETTFGMSRERTYWPSEVVEAGADALAGRHIVRNHPENPGIEDILGQVTDHEFIEGLGLAWQGEIDDRETAKQIHRGRVQASPYLFRVLGEHSDEHNARVAKRILKIRDLGIVPEGASEGTGIEAGPHPELTASESTAEALAAAFPVSSRDERDERQEANKYEETESSSTAMSGTNDDEELEALRSERDELRSENERLEAENETLRQPYLEALTEGTNLAPEDVNLPIEELEARFENEDGTALTVEPVTGGDPGATSEEQTETGVEALSAQETEQLEVLQSRRDLFSGRGMDGYVEQIDGEIEALVGESQ